MCEKFFILFYDPGSSPSGVDGSSDCLHEAEADILAP